MVISRRTVRWKTKKVYHKNRTQLQKNRRRKRVIHNLSQGKIEEGVRGEDLLIKVRKGIDADGRRSLIQGVRVNQEGSKGLGVDLEIKEEAQVRSILEEGKVIQEVIRKNDV